MIYSITSDAELIRLPLEEVIDTCTVRALVCGIQITRPVAHRLGSAARPTR